MIDIQGGVPVTIQQMKYLMAIVYAGSISEAAKQLYVAQSSVSASMRELENEFGFEIFTRGSRGVSLTRKGENLAVDVKTILEKSNLWIQSSKNTMSSTIPFPLRRSTICPVSTRFASLFKPQPVPRIILPI